MVVWLSMYVSVNAFVTEEFFNGYIKDTGLKGLN